MQYVSRKDKYNNKKTLLGSMVKRDWGEEYTDNIHVKILVEDVALK